MIKEISKKMIGNICGANNSCICKNKYGNKIIRPLEEWGINCRLTCCGEGNEEMVAFGTITEGDANWECLTYARRDNKDKLLQDFYVHFGM